MPGVEAEAPSQGGESEKLSKPAAQPQVSETTPWLGVPELEWAHGPASTSSGRELVIWPGYKEAAGAWLSDFAAEQFSARPRTAALASLLHCC